jgi:hypothetical protein
LVKMKDNTDASKVIADDAVPAVAPIVTVLNASEEIAADVAQLTVVDEVHALVVHGPSSDTALEVKSLGPKCNPVTVTEAPSEKGLFRIAFETTGASKLKIESPVPTRAPTVTRPVRRLASGSATDWQFKVVAEFQDAVRHCPNCDPYTALD